MLNARKAEFESGIIKEGSPEKPGDWSKFYAFNNRSGEIDIQQASECKVFRDDDGIPEELDEFAGYGNAINPYVAYEFFKAIKTIDGNF